jgi:hypothetical protein
MLIVKRNLLNEDQIQLEELINNQLQMNDNNLDHHLKEIYIIFLFDFNRKKNLPGQI